MCVGGRNSSEIESGNRLKSFFSESRDICMCIVIVGGFFLSKMYCRLARNFYFNLVSGKVIKTIFCQLSQA